MTQATDPAQDELPQPARRYAIIEIGTRGIRLLIADASRSGIHDIVYSAGKLSYLGEETDPLGVIPASTTRRIRRIIGSYREIAEQNDADEVFAIATETVRAAPNRAQFVNEIGQAVHLDVLDKESEATFSFLATIQAFETELAPGSTVLVLDQGGGSTELICGYLRDDGLPAMKAALTLNFGTLALSNMFVSSPSATQAWASISQRLQQALEEGDHETRFGDLLQRPPDLAVALGSAITFYMRDEIGSVEGKKPTLRSLHGRRVDPGEIDAYLGRIQPTLDEMNLKPGNFAPESDEATVLSGLVIYAAIAQKHAIREYRISRSGMRYGALLWRAGKRALVELSADI